MCRADLFAQIFGVKSRPPRKVVTLNDTHAASAVEEVEFMRTLDPNPGLAGTDILCCACTAVRCACLNPKDRVRNHKGTGISSSPSMYVWEFPRLGIPLT